MRASLFILGKKANLSLSTTKDSCSPTAKVFNLVRRSSPMDMLFPAPENPFRFHASEARRFQARQPNSLHRGCNRFADSTSASFAYKSDLRKRLLLVSSGNSRQECTPFINNPAQWRLWMGDQTPLTHGVDPHEKWRSATAHARLTKHRIILVAPQETRI